MNKIKILSILSLLFLLANMQNANADIAIPHFDQYAIKTNIYNDGNSRDLASLVTSPNSDADSSNEMPAVEGTYSFAKSSSYFQNCFEVIGAKSDIFKCE